MRGKAYQQILPFSKAGITPAYAGKRNCSVYSFHIFRDHPRLCGEKAKIGNDFTGFNRITPAYAGKSQLQLGLTS